MAGAIPSMVQVVNRTATMHIDAMFDGQPVVIPPGYAVEERDGKRVVVGAGPGGQPLGYPLPYFAAEMVMRQNPVMGTEDPEAPNIFESLIGVVGWDAAPIDHLEQSDALERLDRSLMDDEAQEAKPQGRKTKGKKRGGRRYTDAKLRNPGAIRADYSE